MTGRAEAALIALYGARQPGGTAAVPADLFVLSVPPSPEIPFRGALTRSRAVRAVGVASTSGPGAGSASGRCARVRQSPLAIGRAWPTTARNGRTRRRVTDAPHAVPQGLPPCFGSSSAAAEAQQGQVICVSLCNRTVAPAIIKTPRWECGNMVNYYQRMPTNGYSIKQR